MAIHAHSTPAPNVQQPHPSATAAASAAHASAYAASVAAVDRVHSLRAEFDPEFVHEDEDAIGRALAARYGHRFREMGEAYRAAEATSTAAVGAEETAWLAFLNLRPATSDELGLWLAHVLEHSARQDEVVNLREALGLACGWLSERLPTAA